MKYRTKTDFVNAINTRLLSITKDKYLSVNEKDIPECWRTDPYLFSRTICNIIKGTSDIPSGLFKTSWDSRRKSFFAEAGYDAELKKFQNSQRNKNGKSKRS